MGWGWCREVPPPFINYFTKAERSMTFNPKFLLEGSERDPGSIRRSVAGLYAESGDNQNFREPTGQLPRTRSRK